MQLSGSPATAALYVRALLRGFSIHLLLEQPRLGPYFRPYFSCIICSRVESLNNVIDFLQAFVRCVYEEILSKFLADAWKAHRSQGGFAMTFVRPTWETQLAAGHSDCQSRARSVEIPLPRRRTSSGRICWETLRVLFPSHPTVATSLRANDLIGVR